MIEKQINYRVIYGDTDKMGLVYYANYLRIYEMGRSEFLRSIGFPYTELETAGIVCPAVEVNLKYHKSAYYDDLLTVTSALKEMPRAGMIFLQKTFREGLLINEAEIKLCFFDMNIRKPVRCPKLLKDYLSNIGY